MKVYEYARPIPPVVCHPGQDDVPEHLLELSDLEKKLVHQAPETRSGGYADLVKIFRKCDVALIYGEGHSGGNAWQSGNVFMVVLGPFGLQAYTAGRGGFQTQSVFHTLNGLREPRRTDIFSREQARHGLRRFLKALDPDILGALRRARKLSAELYNWVAIAPKERMRAIQSYPSLTGVFKGNHNLELAISFGAPLEDAIAIEQQVKRCSVRCLANTSPIKVDTTPFDYGPNGFPGRTRRVRFNAQIRSDPVLKHLDRIPANGHPVTTPEWHAFHKVVDAARFVDGMETYDLLAKSVTKRQDLVDLDKRMRGRSGDKIGRDINDAVNSTLKAFVVPLAASTGHGNKNALNGAANHGQSSNKARVSLVRLLTENVGIRGLIQFADAWHKRVEVLGTTDKAAEDVQADLTLRQILRERVYLPNTEVWVTPVTTVGEVRAESQTMGHCLGRALLDRVIKGELLAFKLESESLRATGTLQVVRQSEIKMHDARQSGDRTTTLGEAAMLELAQKYGTADRLTGGDEVLEALRVQKARTSGVDGLVDNPDVARYDALNAFEHYKAILPKRLRAETPESLMTGPMFPVFRKVCRKTWPGRTQRDHSAVITDLEEAA